MKTLILCLLTVCLQAQFKVDTVLDRGIYKSYYSVSYKAPVAVTYTLFRGGGEVSRRGKNFIKDTKLPSHSAKDYYKSGYDEGHMASAEDFAYNDSLQNLTFRYSNCIGQTPELNRGAWKKYENKARKISQIDSLIVVCYNEFRNKPASGLNVPAVCYKGVYDYTTKSLVFIVGFVNTKEATEVVITKPVLKYMKKLATECK
jgi:endonuclease G